MSEVIITGFSHANAEGIILYTNVPAKTRDGLMSTKETWVSWDKIGKALFENYTEKESVAERNELRGKS